MAGSAMTMPAELPKQVRWGAHERAGQEAGPRAARPPRLGRLARDECARSADVARRSRPAPALDDLLVRRARLRARLAALPRRLRVGHAHGAALPPEGGGAGVRPRQPGVGERSGLRPALPRAAP